MSESSADIGYPIRVASRRTGLKQDTIRAWERRYGAVAPSRSEGRHRLYSEEDFRRLQLLRRATEAGYSIGRIATLDESALVDLLEADTQDRDDPAQKPSARGNPYLAACLEALGDLDREALEAEIQRAAVELGRYRLVDELLAPLVDAIGRGHESGTLRPMHEHLATSVISAVAQGFLAAFPPPESAPQLLVSTPVHQHHELGAILAASVASSEGWRVTFMGGNLPAEEIAAAAELKRVDALALSIVFPPDDENLPAELRRLRLSLPSLPILVGGSAAHAYVAALEQIGAVAVSDFSTFRQTLAGLRSQRLSPWSVDAAS